MNTLTTKLVDQYGEISETINPLEKLKKELRDEIISSFEITNLETDESCNYYGDDFELNVSVEKEKTLISNPKKLFKLLGKDRFIELATFNIEAIRDELTASDFEKVSTKVKTGRNLRAKRLTNSIKILEKANAI